MIKYFIASLGLISLILDLLLYLWIRRALPKNKIAQRAFLAHFLIIDAAIVIALLMYSRLTSVDSQAYIQIVMWIICIFFMTIIPKLIYSIFSLLDYPLSWIAGKKMKVFSVTGAILSVMILVVMIWSATVGRNNIITKQIVIESERIPATFNGYRIAFISDLHVGNLPKSGRLIKNMVNIINNENVDMVVNGGDIVNSDARELNENLMEILASIRSVDGVYSVFGNHDLGFYIGDNVTITPSQSVDMLRNKQAEMGWKMLDNQSSHITRGNDSIAIGGVNYPTSGSHNGRDSGLGGSNLEATLNNVDDSTFTILISHTPELWNKILSDSKADLTLSGHVHAMQLKLTAGKWRWSPAKWMYERWSGLYNEQDRNLYINDGMGYVMYPMRVGTRPEITIITLKSI